MLIYSWLVFVYLGFDLAGVFGAPPRIVQVGKAVSWVLMLLGLVGVLGGLR